MKPKPINFDSIFEKHWHKYLAGLTEKQKERLRERLAIFKEDVFDKRLGPFAKLYKTSNYVISAPISSAGGGVTQ